VLVGLVLFSFLFSSLPLNPNARAPQGVPASSQTRTVAGLRGRVTVRRDERGIPYIEATNESDLYFAQGFVTASDRLWQMDLHRRTARGELSEIFGRGQLEEDKRRRMYGSAAIAEASVGRISPPVRAALEAYARGVNAYIATLDEASLPPEFQLLGYRPRAWTPADSLIIGKIFAEALSTTWPTDLVREVFADIPADKRDALFPVASPLDLPVVGTDAKPSKKASVSPKRTHVERSVSMPETESARNVSTTEINDTLDTLARIEATMRSSLERVGLYAEDGRAASNNWVVGGKRTVSGKPLLANDPHLAPSAPSIWYLTHLSAPNLRVAGVATPGAPGIIIGHNEQIAWGMTNLGPDVQDLYRERFDTANPRRYMTPTGWREAEVRREEIKVRKSPTEAAAETVHFETVVTRHGPVIYEKDGRRYALRWTALDANAVEFEGFYKLNRARNWNEFRDALRSYKGPTQNFVYADTSGHIGYYGAGLIPVRRSGDGSTPYDGATDAGEWTGFIPFDELPHVYDPPSGIIVTANNRIVSQSYTRHLTHEWASPVRARRIYEMLTAKQKLTADDFRAIQGDVRSISAAIFAREVVKVARAARLDASDHKWRETIRLFDGWNGEIVPESRAARLAAAMRTTLLTKVLTGAVGAERAKAYSWDNRDTFVNRIVEQRPAAWLPREYKSYAELFAAVHAEARETLSKRIGADESKWTWGQLTQVRFPHPLAGIPIFGQPYVVAPFPQRGGGANLTTVNVGAGVSMRLIADAADWDKTQQGIALGQSGLPRSPHWKDQLTDWMAATPRVFPFTPRAVAAAAQETLTLTPATK
jgi:penicillin amidase